MKIGRDKSIKSSYTVLAAFFFSGKVGGPVSSTRPTVRQPEGGVGGLPSDRQQGATRRGESRQVLGPARER